MKQDSVARIYLLAIAFITILWGQILVVPLLVILATTLAVFLRWRWKINDTDWIAFACFMLCATLSCRFVIPPRVDALEWLLPPWLVLAIAEFLLIASAIELFRRHDRGRLPTHFPAWGLGVLICNHHHSASRLQHYLFLLSALLCVALAVTFFQLNRAERVSRQQQRTKGQFSLLMGLMLLIAMFSWQSYEVFANTENSALIWLLDRTEKQRQQKMHYESIGELDSVTRLQKSKPNQTALEVHSVDEPGYLRGQVYETFMGMGWDRNRSIVQTERELIDVRLNLPALVQAAIQDSRMDSDQQVFRISPENPRATEQDKTSPTQEMHVFNDPERGIRFFMPTNTTYIKGVSHFQQIQLDQHGIVQNGLDEKKPYTAYYRDGETPLSAWNRRIYSWSGQSTYSIMSKKLSSEICSNTTTSSEKISAVEDYCQANFQVRGPTDPTLIEEAKKRMSLRGEERPTPEEMRDLNLAKSQPLTYFFQQKPAATCEYFASAAVVLLREAGVPARYVTGYVVRQRKGKHQWSALNRDAHAWAEAYDDELKRWVTVEATPGMIKAKSKRGQGQNQVKLASPKPKPKLKIAKVEEKSLYRRFQYWLGKVLGLPVILFLVGLVTAVVLISRRFQNALPQEQLWLAYVERILGKHGLVRKDGETLHQFSQRVKLYPYGDKQNPPLREFAGWLTSYAFFRYGRSMYALHAPPGVAQK